MGRWVQIPISELSDKNAIKLDNFVDDAIKNLSKLGGTYTNEEGIDMLELHVDSIRDDKYSALHKYVKSAEKQNNGLCANQISFFKR